MEGLFVGFALGAMCFVAAGLIAWILGPAAAVWDRWRAEVDEPLDWEEERRQDALVLQQELWREAGVYTDAPREPLAGPPSREWPFPEPDPAPRPLLASGAFWLALAASLALWTALWWACT